MNIDVTALLQPGSAEPQSLSNSDVSLADFGVALDEKLTELAEPEMTELLEALPLTMADWLKMQPRQDEKPEEEEQPAAEESADPAIQALVNALPKSNAQWNLQQLIARTASGDKPMLPVDGQGGKKSLNTMLGEMLQAVGKQDNLTIAGTMLLPAGKKDEAALPALMPLSAGKKEQAAAADNMLSKGSLSPTTFTLQASSTLASSTAQGTSPAESAVVPTVIAAPMPAIIRPAPAPVAVTSVSVPHHPQTPEWKQAVSQQIVTFTRNDIHNAEIRLHPEELGALQISLRLHQEQAKIHIVSEHALVRQAMEQAMPQLRAALAEAGVQLSQANVSADNPYAGFGAQGEAHSEEQQAHEQHEEMPTEEENVPTLLTSVPGNIYGINTFA